MEYIAHIGPDGQIQTVKEHSENTARSCESFAIPEMKSICNLVGALHDIGKYQPDFQERIRGKNIRVEHSISGAKEISKQKYGNTPMGLMMQLCIAGHHTGLPDCGTRADNDDNSTLYGRLKRNTGDYSAFNNDIKIESGMDVPQFNEYLSRDCSKSEDLIEKFAFLTRYCYSCLVDADTLDTINATGNNEPRSLISDFAGCYEKIDTLLASFKPVTALQKARAKLQQQVFKNIKSSSEIYLMNMPTGSGKTLTSMKCALYRAISGGKRRIIYIIPYNSIIDQTAEIFENLFGDKAQILRHQSTFSYEDLFDADEDYRVAAKNAGENWDAQIIITTAVQFFESFYSNRRSKLRKLHNMADSILVFDEAHLMPREYLQPCLRAIAYITRYLNSEALLLTATMPDFKNLVQRYAISGSQVYELIGDTSDFESFDKCSYEYLGIQPDESIAAGLSECPTGLAVMNTRKGARDIYDSLSGEKYYLSTYLTGYDRARIIAQIKERIKQLKLDYPDLTGVPQERKIHVVSTTLIEAGVDLDFSCVYRELSGLDSILQAGGRCNREGYSKSGKVFIFEREFSKVISVESSIAKDILLRGCNPASPEAISEYYSRLLAMESDDIVSNSISTECKGLNQIPFNSYAEGFRFIKDGKSVSIAVCRDESSREMLEMLRTTGNINKRKIQKYTCTVYMNEFQSLLSQGVADDFGSGVFFLTNPDYYDENTGIQLNGKDIFI